MVGFSDDPDNFISNDGRFNGIILVFLHHIASLCNIL